jgi:NAD(P)-dependent dehydrogenase (short-subunit alcohol dehydrogenase family)
MKFMVGSIFFVSFLLVVDSTGLASFRAKSLPQVRRSARTTPISLKGKVVLITGATAGIGESCAYRFAEEGCNLVLVGRRSDRLQSMKDDILAAYPDVAVHIVPMSVTDFDVVAALPNSLPDAFKNVEILVNNAGLALGVAPADSNDIRDARTVLDTNVMGSIALCRAFLPGMKERESGHIINMGSVAVRQQPTVFSPLFYFSSSPVFRVTTGTQPAPFTSPPSTHCVDSPRRRAMTSRARPSA